MSDTETDAAGERTQTAAEDPEAEDTSAGVASNDGEPTQETATAEDPSDREVELAVLREENRRLREEHRRLLQSGYRRSALGFGALAVLALAGVFVFDAVRDVLLAVAAIAAFAGLLTYYLTPERFVAASVGESVYDSVAWTGRDLIDDLGLQNNPIYLPTEEGDVRVFLPQHSDYTLPELNIYDGLLIVPEDDRARGVTLYPTGHDLYNAFETAVSSPLSEESAPGLLAEALVQQFELVDSASVDSREPGRVTFAISGSAYGGVDRFDHPVASILATGLANVLDEPIELETSEPETMQADYLVTCRWETDDDEDADEDQSA